MSCLDGFNLCLFTSLLQAFAQGAHDPLLCAVLHMCLIKKQLKWLTPNSCPILLAAFHVVVEISLDEGDRCSGVQ